MRTVFTLSRSVCRQIKFQQCFKQITTTIPPASAELAKRIKKESAATPSEASEAVEAVPIEYDDGNKFVFLFPGQGAQFVGMARDMLDPESAKYLAIVKSMFDRASQILDYDLAQPATVVASLAAVEQVFSVKPSAIENCIATAGFSVGEITALIFSGALTFDQGIQLVKARGEAMQYCSELEPSGMLSVIKGSNADLSLATEAAKRWTKENHGISKPVCQVANHLSIATKVIAGHLPALQFIQDNMADFGIKRAKRVAVSGAFHTPLMNQAADIFNTTLARCRISTPRIPVHSNVNMHVYQDARDIKKVLGKQMVSAVKWEQSMNRIFAPYDNDINRMPVVVECGPGSVLTTVLRKINGKSASKAFKVEI